MKLQYIILIVVIVVLGVLVYINRDWFKKMMQSPADKQGTDGNSGTSSSTNSGGNGGTKSNATATGSNGLNNNLLLKNGVRGNEVKELQRLLNVIDHNDPLVEDGIFGPKTEAKLKKYNSNVGYITLNQAYSKIAAISPGTPTGNSSTTSSNWWDSWF